MISCRAGGVSLRVHFSFLLFNALFFLFLPERAGDFYISCILHELGHILTAAALGQRLLSVDMRGTGILMIPEKKAAAPFSHGLAVLLSGPAVNLLLWAAASGELAGTSLALGLYNLLPYSQLDGGAVLELLISGTSGERTARRVLLGAKLVLSAGLFIVSLRDVRAIPLLIVSVLLLAGDM